MPVDVRGPMLQARKIVEDHIAAYGMVPHPDKIKEEIATAIGFAQLASIPHRDKVEELLHKVVDLTWGYAMEDGSVPLTKTADTIIATARASQSP
jgi:hypothetical protein